MTLSNKPCKEERRLIEDTERSKYWKKWGTYLSERTWGVPREDYTDEGDAWQFDFETSKSRVFRWNEQGMAGVCDSHQFLNLSMVLWNENDDILKESLFGLPGGAGEKSGNHGEDVKELYYYLDNTPTHSYAKFLYKYPISKFPYEQLYEENSKRSKLDSEFEITDTGVFENNNYFDVFFEMGKDDEDPEEINFRITAYNRSNAAAPLHIIPQAFFRNTWGWNHESEQQKEKPELWKVSDNVIGVKHWKLGERRIVFAPAPGYGDDDNDVEPTLLFCDNETNFKKLYNIENKTKYCKDGFHDCIVNEDESSVNPENRGTKACAWFVFDQNGGVPPGDYVTIRYKLTSDISPENTELNEEALDDTIALRINEADEFYWNVAPLPIPQHLRNVQRQAFSGLLWTKQYYHFIHDYWYRGDPNSDLPPTIGRANQRNKEWKHLYNDNILSMPDNFEYPFYCSWDTAFHTIPLAMIDPEFAKKQLDLLTREWYMSPQGQIPAYEWNFSDTNPPVQAWAAYRIYKIEKKNWGFADRPFLERVFQKLMLNFTWWVNRKDVNGNGIFEGGFLGLDNISIFNRSEPPDGVKLLQSDASGWIAWYSLTMMNIALELAKDNPVYEDVASKFFEHYILIADAMTFLNKNEKNFSPTSDSLWDIDDEFFYDKIQWNDDSSSFIKVRSMVGLIPLFATTTIEPDVLKRFPSFAKRIDWLSKNKSYLFKRHIASMDTKGDSDRLLLSLVNKDRLLSILKKLFDETEFLSNYGVRSLSKFHEENPFQMEINGQTYSASYLSGESDSGMFGGNSNWRGPIWFPMNFLLIESLLRFYLYYGSSLKVEAPVGSGDYMNLGQAAEEIQQRLIHLFMPDKDGYKAYHGRTIVESDNDDEIELSEQQIRYNEALNMLNNDEHFKDLVNFYEYFDGDTGRGLGSKWQCGWTALVARMIQDVGVICREPNTAVKRRSYTQDDIQNYDPRPSPYSNFMRRKSGKSLLNLAAHKLELDDDEKNLHQSGVPGLSRASSAKTFSSNHSTNEDFLQNVREAMARYEISDGVNVNTDEYETTQ